MLSQVLCRANPGALERVKNQGPHAEEAPQSGPPDLGTRKGANVDRRLELIIVPVSNVGRAKAFYTKILGINVRLAHQ